MASQLGKRNGVHTHGSYQMYISNEEAAIRNAAVSSSPTRFKPRFINSEPWRPCESSTPRDFGDVGGYAASSARLEQLLYGVSAGVLKKTSRNDPDQANGTGVGSSSVSTPSLAPPDCARPNTAPAASITATLQPSSAWPPKPAGSGRGNGRGRAWARRLRSTHGIRIGEESCATARPQVWQNTPPGPRPHETPFATSRTSTPAKLVLPAMDGMPAVHSPVKPPSPMRPRSDSASRSSAQARLGIVSPQHPHVAEDDTVRELACRVKKAFTIYCWQHKTKRVCSTLTGEWLKFLAAHDANGHKSFDLEAFDQLLRVKLNLSISRYELRVLHRRLDVANAGNLTHHELGLLMWRVELADWPEISDHRLERIINKLTDSAERCHRSGGNWIAICKQAIHGWDIRKGTVTFHELRHCVRSVFPGLLLKTKDISESSLKGLWKRFDGKQEMEVPVQQFMSFLRRHGVRSAPKIEDIPELPEQVGHDVDTAEVAKKLAAAMRAWLAKYGRRSANAESSPSVWQEFFVYHNKEAQNLRGRMKFQDFAEAIATTLHTDMRQEELYAVWSEVDEDQSGELTLEEFGVGLYRLQIQHWPDLEQRELRRAISVLNHASNHWHRAGGNWFKIFSLLNVDEVGDLEFEEMLDVVRSLYPGLGIKKDELTDRELQGLWKAMDQDLSGRISVMEFMVFMRKHSHGLDMWRSRRTRKHGRRYAIVDELSTLGPSPERSREQLRAIARTLEKVVNMYVGTQTSKLVRDLGTKWDALLAMRRYPNPQQRVGLPGLLTLLYTTFENRSGANGEKQINDWDQPQQLLTQWKDDMTVAHLDGVGSVSCGDVRALWTHVAEHHANTQISTSTWQNGLYRLEVERWPTADPATLERAVSTISEAAERWHRAGNNWYKVFRLFDEDQSRAICFEEFTTLVRRPCPCLSLNTDKLPESDLRALWKALDADCSGEVSVGEFIAFLRRRAAKAKATIKGTAAAASNAEVHSRPSTARCETVGPAVDLRAAETALSGRHGALLRDALSAASIDSIELAYEEWDIPWTGRISEWTWLRIVREVLGLGPDQLDEDSVHVVWAALDRSKVGEVEVATLLELGWEREASCPASADGSASVSPAAKTTASATTSTNGA